MVPGIFSGDATVTSLRLPILRRSWQQQARCRAGKIREDGLLGSLPPGSQEDTGLSPERTMDISGQEIRARVPMNTISGFFWYLLGDDQMGRFVDFVGLRAIEKIERIDLHIDEFGIIERLVLLLSLLIPENDNTVLHSLAAHNIVHILQ